MLYYLFLCCCKFGNCCKDCDCGSLTTFQQRRADLLAGVLFYSADIATDVVSLVLTFQSALNGDSAFVINRYALGIQMALILLHALISQAYHTHKTYHKPFYTFLASIGLGIVPVVIDGWTTIDDDAVYTNYYAARFVEATSESLPMARMQTVGILIWTSEYLLREKDFGADSFTVNQPQLIYLLFSCVISAYSVAANMDKYWALANPARRKIKHVTVFGWSLRFYAMTDSVMRAIWQSGLLWPVCFIMRIIPNKSVYDEYGVMLCLLFAGSVFHHWWFSHRYGWGQARGHHKSGKEAETEADEPQSPGFVLSKMMSFTMETADVDKCCDYPEEHCKCCYYFTCCFACRWCCGCTCCSRKFWLFLLFFLVMPSTISYLDGINTSQYSWDVVKCNSFLAIPLFFATVALIVTVGFRGDATWLALLAVVVAVVWLISLIALACSKGDPKLVSDIAAAAVPEVDLVAGRPGMSGMPSNSFGGSIGSELALVDIGGSRVNVARPMGSPVAGPMGSPVGGPVLQPMQSLPQSTIVYNSPRQQQPMGSPVGSPRNVQIVYQQQGSNRVPVMQPMQSLPQQMQQPRSPVHRPMQPMQQMQQVQMQQSQMVMIPGSARVLQQQQPMQTQQMRQQPMPPSMPPPQQQQQMVPMGHQIHYAPQSPHNTATPAYNPHIV